MQLKALFEKFFCRILQVPKLISLIQTIKQSKARQIYATHGETRVLTRYLNDHMGVAADRLETAFGIEQGADQ